jgi:acyl-CoA synthetase (AMP-forming)/AMP-acid ligase II
MSTIAPFFRAVVRRDPDAAAVSCGGQVCTYRDLERRAIAIARRVNSHSTAAKHVVILVGDDPIAEIAAILGVIAAGGVAVPIETHQPERLIAALVAHSQPSMLLASAPLAQLARAVAGPTGVDEIGDAIDDGRFEEARVVPDDPAYVCFTSGSTGQPKSAVLSHERILQKIISGRSNDFGGADRHTLLHSLSTAAGCATTTRALLTGGALLPWNVRDSSPRGLRDFLDSERATVLAVSPTFFRAFVAGLSSGDRIESVRVVRMVGERVMAGDFERFKRHFAPGAKFLITYSQTEAGNIAMLSLTHDSVIPGGPRDDGMMPVGYPARDCRLRIVDEQGDELPAGSVGEIVVENRGVARGTWNEGGPAGVVRTGDLGRLDPDGLLWHMGRRDFQVKIRGHRVELEAVEAVLSRAPGVANAAVIVHPSVHGEPQLVAYAAVDRQVIDARRLRAFAEANLAAGGVPSRFVVVDALPLTNTGKVDRRALAELERASEVGEAPAYWSERPDLEQCVAGIWRDLLGHGRFTAGDGFMHAGGDSLIAMRVLARVRNDLGVDVRTSDFLAEPTVAALAAHIERLQGQARHSDEVELARLIDEAEASTRE